MSEFQTDLTKSGHQTIADLINFHNKTNYSAGDIVIGRPMRAAGSDRPDAPYNTDIEVTFELPAEAGESEPKVVTGEVHYDRLDLGRLFQNKDFTFYDNGFTDVASLLPVLAEEVRVVFDAEDLVQATIPADAPYPKSVVIRATDHSLRFYGQFPVVIKEAIVDDPSFLITPVQETNPPISALAKNPDGTLVHGTGNPSGALVGASNGEIEILAGARYYQNPMVIQPVDDVYHLNVGDTSDWNFPHSFALINTSNGARITDLYDCSMKITALDTNAFLDFKLVREYGKLKLVDSANSLVIEDLTASNDKQTLYQDIQRLTFYRNKLGASLPINAINSPYGNFRFELTAARKQGGVDPVVVSFDVIVQGPASSITP